MNVNITSLKISLIIIIFFSGVFGVLSPRLFKPFGSRLSYASLLSSGVLLAAALVHLLGDAADALESSPLPKTADGEAYPWAYFFCGLSFYFLYFFELFVLHSLTHKNNHQNDNNDNNDDNNHLSTSSQSAVNMYKAPLIDNSNNPTPVKSIFSDQSSPNVQPTATPSSNNGYHETDELAQEMSEDHGAEIFQLMKSKNYMTGIVLLIGLGLHSFLAGVALGSSEEVNTFNPFMLLPKIFVDIMQQTKEAVALGVAIISHKYLAAFALGVPLFKSEMNMLASVSIAVIFGSLTPFGIGIGWILAKAFDNWIGDVFVSIAAGTFIYVSICEVLIPEFSEKKQQDKIIYRLEKSRRELSKQTNTPLSVQSAQLKAIKNEIQMKENKKMHKREVKKTISVFIGFVLMSALAFWV